MAIEIVDVFPLNMVIFHDYLSLPEGISNPPRNTMVSLGAVHRWSRRTAVQDAFLEDRSGGLQDTLDPWIQLLGRAPAGKGGLLQPVDRCFWCFMQLAADTLPTV